MKNIVSLLTAFVLVFGAVSSFAEEAVDSQDEAQVLAIVEQVNINEADATTIATALNYVGQKRAEAIVAWREANGKFTSLEQLLEVKGIGQATLDKNSGRILF